MPAPTRARIAPALLAALAACGDSTGPELRYTDAEIEYFLEIALGFEYGDASRVVRKWAGDVGFQVFGSPTPEDRAMLDDVVADINALTSTSDLVEVHAEPAVEIHFAHTDTFPEILPGYVPGNLGYFSVWWGGDRHIYRSVVLIATNTSQEVRNHLVREEVTQMLGMGNDSNRYPESIFLQAFSTVSAYAPLDEAVIEILYRPEILVGMDEDEARATARMLERGVVLAASPASAPARGPAVGPPGTASGGHSRRP